MTDYNNILVAIDFSDAVDTVIQKAVEVAHRNHTQFTVLHAVEFSPPPGIGYDLAPISDWTMYSEVLIKNATESLKKLCDKHQLTEVKPVVVLGATKYEICNYASEHDCDLIIMGSHGYHGIRRLLGSTANGVLHEMPCDVMVVKITE